MIVLTIFDFLASLFMLAFVFTMVSVFAGFSFFALYGILHVVFDKALTVKDRAWTTFVLLGLSAWGFFLGFETYKLVEILWAHIMSLVR